MLFTRHEKKLETTGKLPTYGN